MKLTFGLFSAALAISAGCASAQVLDVTYPQPAEGLSKRVYSYWTVFHHPWYGYEMPVPPGVRSIGEPEAATRTKFVSPDGAFVMSAWGGVISQPPQSVIDALWAEALAKRGRTLNYQRRAATWYVVSGTSTTGTEFYEKFTMRGSHVAAFTLTYPRERRRDFDPWVEGIEKSFRVVDIPAKAVPVHLLPTSRSESTPEGRSPVSSGLPPHSSASHTATATTNRGTPATASRTPGRAPDPAIDLTPPPTRQDLAPSKLEPQSSPKPEQFSAPRKPNTIRPELPVGEKVPGKPGFVYTPFRSEKTIVDVEGIASGTRVQCPITGKVFRVP